MTTSPDEIADAVQNRMARAREIFEDARVLALAFRWNGCVCRLCHACTSAMAAILEHRGLHNPDGLPPGGRQARDLLDRAQMPTVLTSGYVDLLEKCRGLETGMVAAFERDDAVAMYAFAEEFIDYVDGVVHG
jgi:hypothetical protein